MKSAGPGRLKGFMVALFVALAPLVPGGVSAQTGAVTPDSLNETYGAWEMKCGAGLTECHVTQSMFAQDGDRRLLRITIFSPPGGDGSMLFRALTPLGARLPNGAVVEVDGGSKITMPFVTCLARGCLAETPMTPELEAALRDGKTLAVMIVAATGGKTIRFELALGGLEPALDRMAGF